MNVIVYFNSMSAAGGIERVVTSHIDFLSEVCKVTLVTKDDIASYFPLTNNITRESLQVDFTMNMNSRWRRVSKIAISLFSTTMALRKLIKKIKPDVVYVASPLNLFEIFLAGIKPKKILVTEHSSFSANNGIYRSIIKMLYPNVGLLTVPTKMDSQGYLEQGIRNFHIPNPLPFYSENVADLNNKLAICVGRLTPDKRHDLLIDIWNLSEIRNYGWKLKIIGKGECEPDLLRKIEVLGLEGSVVIDKPTPLIQDEYIKASIFLLTSRTEGFGLVLAEAMTFGIPCISFDCPSGPRDIIENGVTGFLLEEGDVNGYAEALQQLSKNSSLRMELGQRARISVCKFDSKIIKSQFIDAFKQSFFDGQTNLLTRQ